MIVPQNRLVLFVGFTLLPMLLVAAAVPAVLPLIAGIWVVIVSVCVLDALYLARLCGGVQAEFPQRVNVVRNRDETFNFSVSDKYGLVGSLHIGLGLPPEITSSREEFLALLPRDPAGLKIAWPIHAQRRGEYVVSKSYFRVPSRLGLWFKQGSLDAGTRIRVYPDLLGEGKRISALFLHRNGPGCFVQRQVGKGKDFEKLRDYLPGDNMGDIHWRVTAKRGRLVTKEYQLERTQEIYVVIDASRLSSQMIDPPGQENGDREPLLERYITACLCLGDFVQRQGDRFGLITVGNRVLSFIRAGRGKGHFQVCRDMLLDLHPQTVTPDFEELAALILKNLRRRALLLCLTSLSDPTLAESFLAGMEAVSRRHVLLVNMLRPPLAKPLFSDQNVVELPDIYRRLGGHLQWHNLQELEVNSRRQGIGFFLVDHENLGVEMASRYISVKRRQVL